MSRFIHGYTTAWPHARYRGIDRLPWEATETAYYADALPGHLVGLYAGLLQPGPWLPRFVADLSVAKEFLAFERQARPGAEVVGFSAPYLAAEGLEEREVGDEAVFLGFDLLGGVGEWSLIRALLDDVGEGERALLPLVALLNEHGLLQSADQAPLVLGLYDELAAQDLVEHRLNDDGYLGWQVVGVYLPGG